MSNTKTKSGKTTTTKSKTVTKTATRMATANKVKALETTITQLQADKAKLEMTNNEVVNDMRLIGHLITNFLGKEVFQKSLNFWTLITSVPSLVKLVKEIIRVIKEKGYVPADLG